MLAIYNLLVATEALFVVADKFVCWAEFCALGINGKRWVRAGVFDAAERRISLLVETAKGNVET